MRVRFLGTGAAEGVPAAFCNCDVCRRAREIGGREIRSRTQIVVDDVLGIDFPPDAYAHSLRFGVDLSSIGHLLVTHSHMDHFYAHDFILRGYKYASDMGASFLHIYGNAEVKKVFAECTRRELREDVGGTIVISEIEPFRPFAAGEYLVTAFPAVHSKEERALLYLVEKGDRAYLHLHDTGKVEEEIFRYLKEQKKKLSLVALDCTLLDTNSSVSGRHMGLAENLAVMERLKKDGTADEKTKFVITHFSHNSAPFTSRLRPLEEKYGVIAAYDGMTVEI